MTSWAIIPARGGSKRIAGKNIKAFLGKPIIAYSIETALRSDLFERVIVSTDDEEITKVALDYGAECPFIRPNELADDYATTGQVMCHAATWCLEQEKSAQYLCCLYPTAPMVQVEDLQKGLDSLVSEMKAFVFSATNFSYPVQRGFCLRQDHIHMLHPEHYETRSQDLPTIYHDAGQFYWGQTDAFAKKKPIISPASGVVTLPSLRCQDIDTSDDWCLAEALYENMRLKQ